jgi:phage gp36-like protein
VPVPLFASIADMEARFDRVELVQLTNQSGDDSLDQARLTQALKRASNEILSYIAAKYDVAAGLSEAAEERLRDLCCDLAFYYLFRETPKDGVKDRYKAALAALDGLAKGITKLDTGSQEITARPEGVLVSVPERVLGREALEGF